MKKEEISWMLGGIEMRYIEEAESFESSRKRKLTGKERSFGRSSVVLAVAAVFILVIVLASVSAVYFSGRAVVYAYAYGTDEKLTKAGVVLHTGTVADDGEQKGHPLMFYLSGENIESVRFSCKNQELTFTDWTEKREEYRRAGNFTIPYGDNEDEYFYLTIDWEPGETIRRLHEGYTIATLPKELKEDLIVMEITFSNGEQTVKAIHISLLSDGTFFVAFDDYEITSSDGFVGREDAHTVREQAELRPSEPEEKEYPTGGSEGISEREATGKYQNEEPQDEGMEKAVLAARETAETYYAGTVFEVVSMEVRSVSEEEVVFSVRVKKDGILQEPDRSITLEQKDGTWNVVNEGY